MIEPIMGVHWLPDFYSILGLERGAQMQEITQAYHGRMKSVHPDRFQGLDEKLLKSAEAKAGLYVQAYGVLKDANRRQKYDAQLDSFDPELISKDGTPIFHMGKRQVMLDVLLKDNSASLAQIEEKARAISGFDENMLNVLRATYAAKPDDEGIKQAYLSALIKKQAYLSVLEDLRWEDAGVHGQQDTKHLTYAQDHLKQRTEQIEAYVGEISSAVKQRMLAIGQGLAPLLLGTSHEGTIQENLEEKVTTLALERFSQKQAILEKTAQERVETLGELEKLTEWRYAAPKTEGKSELLILLKAQGKVQDYLGYSYVSGSLASLEKDCTALDLAIAQGEPLTSAILEGIVQQGRNIAEVSLNFEFDPHLQLAYVVRQHFGIDRDQSSA